LAVSSWPEKLAEKMTASRMIVSFFMVNVSLFSAGFSVVLSSPLNSGVSGENERAIFQVHQVYF